MNKQYEIVLTNQNTGETRKVYAYSSEFYDGQTVEQVAEEYREEGETYSINTYDVDG